MVSLVIIWYNKYQNLIPICIYLLARWLCRRESGWPSPSRSTWRLMSAPAPLGPSGKYLPTFPACPLHPLSVNHCHQTRQGFHLRHYWWKEEHQGEEDSCPHCLRAQQRVEGHCLRWTVWKHLWRLTAVTVMTTVSLIYSIKTCNIIIFFFLKEGLLSWENLQDIGTWSGMGHAYLGRSDYSYCTPSEILTDSKLI